VKRSGRLSKAELTSIAEVQYHGMNGDFIYDPDYQQCADLDGSEARRYLESRGFQVVTNCDTGRNGIAITECGVRLSTNGFIYKAPSETH